MDNYKIYDINYFENEHIKITLYKNNYSDKFGFYINKNNDFDDNTKYNVKIIIKRIDSLNGWGQNLNILVYNKLKQEEEIIYIGACEENIKIIDFSYNNKSENIYLIYI